MEIPDQKAYHSMYLQTLPNQKKIQLNPHRNPSLLNTSDIEGARPKFIEKPIKPRQTFYNRNDDIDKSRSKRLIPQTVNKIDKQLEIDDIRGTRTQVNKFQTTRKTDPLNPSYQLSEIILAEVPQPKFIKDSLNIDDIQGTRTKQTFVRRMENKGKILQKQPLLTEQKNKKLAPKVNNYLLDVTDINLKEKDKLKERDTNPLDPVYRLAQSDQYQELYGKIQGSQPCNPKAHIKCPDFCLNVKDIPGCAPKTRKFIKSSKQLEITGSKPNTVKRGLSSNRKTNPLNPNYRYIGQSQTTSYSRPKTAAQRLDRFLS